MAHCFSIGNEEFLFTLPQVHGCSFYQDMCTYCATYFGMAQKGRASNEILPISNPRRKCVDSFFLLAFFYDIFYDGNKMQRTNKWEKTLSAATTTTATQNNNKMSSVLCKTLYCACLISLANYIMVLFDMFHLMFLAILFAFFNFIWKLCPFSPHLLFLLLCFSFY